MNLSNLKPAAGSTKTRKRIGRGPGSGLGGTSTRGHKGAKSRSGYSKKIGFEGGQMPLQRRLPKYGFKNINRVEYKAINIGTLQEIATSKNVDVIDLNLLNEVGYSVSNSLIKVLGNGSLTSKLTVSAHAFSASAKAAIEAQGGTVVIPSFAVGRTQEILYEIDKLKEGKKDDEAFIKRGTFLKSTSKSLIYKVFNLVSKSLSLFSAVLIIFLCFLKLILDFLFNAC